METVEAWAEEHLDSRPSRLRHNQRPHDRSRRKGGKVSDESNLSQSGCSWIFEDAEVTGDARVSENAVVHGDARVYDNAQVYGSAEVYDKARVYDDAEVYGNANIFGRAQVYGYARVYDHAIVHGRAKVYDTALVYERAQVFGEANVFRGPATVYDVSRVERLRGQVYGEAKSTTSQGLWLCQALRLCRVQ